MTLDDMYKDFEYMLDRELMEFEMRMIRHTYINAFATGIVRGLEMENSQLLEGKYEK